MVAVVVLEVVAGRSFYVSPDSIHYVGTARNLINGEGFTVPPGSAPIGHFPPLFTLVLAAIGQFGPDPLSVARWLNPLLLGASVVLAGLLVRRITNSITAGVVAAVLAGFSFDILAYHASALSEPLFLTAALATLNLLATYLERRSRWLLLSAGATAGAALLTRYAGVALVVAGVAVLVWYGRKRRWRGALDAAAYAALAGVPTSVWLAWARHQSGRATERALGYRDVDAGYFSRGARTVSQWLVPGSIGAGWRMAVAALLAGALVVLGVRLARRRPAPALSDAARRVVTTFALTYLALLVFDRLFVDRTGMLDLRLLSPLHVAGIVLVVALAHRVATTEPLPRIRNAVVACGLLVVGLQVGETVAWVADGIRHGGAARGGFTAPAWRRSEVVRRAGARAAHQPVYSNAADAVFFLTGRRAEPVPARSDYLSGKPNRRLDEQLAAVHAALHRGEGALVWFHAFRGRDGFLPTEAELRDALGLRADVTDEVGTLYVAGDSAPAPVSS